jgi:hypothetical protein
LFPESGREVRWELSSRSPSYLLGQPETPFWKRPRRDEPRPPTRPQAWRKCSLHPRTFDLGLVVFADPESMCLSLAFGLAA